MEFQKTLTKFSSSKMMKISKIENCHFIDFENEEPPSMAPRADGTWQWLPTPLLKNVFKIFVIVNVFDFMNEKLLYKYE